MARTLCIWYPDWPLRRADVPSDRPCLIVGEVVAAVGDSGGGGRAPAEQRVVALDALAEAAGARRGMRRREAEALCPDGVCLERDLGAETRAFEPLAGAVEQLVPKIEVVEPGLLFVPVAGAVRYYGGEEQLVEQIRRVIETVAGPGWRMGLADGPFAARWAAATADGVRVVTDEAGFLASLDVTTLGVDELVATFRWLGITTLGDLSHLPRAAVVSRFGEVGLQAHRLASGEDRLPRPRAIRSDFRVEDRFEEPLVLLEQVAFAARSLAYRLMSVLAPHGIAPHRVEVGAEAADGTVRHRVWRSADPFTEATLAERVWWQLRAWTESGGVPGGLAALALAPADLSGDGRQLALLEDAAAAIETERALARVQTLVGPDGVLRSRPQGGRDPSEQVQWHRWGEEPSLPERETGAPWPGRTPQPTPALVPPRSPPLEVEWDAGMPVRIRLGSRWVPVLSWAGPWRHVGRWWKGSRPADRYQIVTSAGAFLCEVDGEGTVLVGIYD